VAAENGLSQATAALLRRKAKVETKDPQGRTPLELAIRGNHHAVANLLIPLTNVKDHKFTNGQTLLHWAADNNMPEAVKALIERGANASAAGQDGDTPLHAAAWHGHVNVIDVLLAAKVDANAADDAGRTPLHSAAWNGHLAAVQALLKAGADPRRAAEGYTPLHAAAWQGHQPIVAALLAAGAKIDAQDADGSTPLHKAAWRGHGEIVRALLVAGANEGLTDNDGFTAADKARSAKREVVVGLLATRSRANARAAKATPAATNKTGAAGKPTLKSKKP
jgi:cytohesin